MRVLVISQYFWPENFRINDLVAGLVGRGHEVTVLTGQPNYPSGKFAAGYGWLGPRFERRFGADIFRVGLVPRGSGSRLRLALNYVSFMIAACLGLVSRLPRDRRFDAIFVFQLSPFTVGVPAVVARWRYRAPVLFWVLDLWPESLGAVGAVRSAWLLRPVEWVVRWVYGRCDRVLVQSRAFVPAVVRYGVPDDAIRYFPNWGEAVFDSRSASEGVPGLPGGFRVLYAGNVGAAQDFPAILDAATQLAARTDIQWIIVGDGSVASWARDESSRRGLDRTVHFLGQRSLESMPRFFAACDALLVSLKRDPVLALTVPGKLQSYLASGVPILAVLDGEGARILAESGAGIHCPPGDSGALASAVERLAALPATERLRMGRNGRDYYEKNFSRERVFDLLESVLADAVEHRRE